MTGRVTRNGVSRWTEPGGSYRAIQRLFATNIDWLALNWCFFAHGVCDRAGVCLLVGDETVISKAVKKTFGFSVLNREQMRRLPHDDAVTRGRQIQPPRRKESGDGRPRKSEQDTRGAYSGPSGGSRRDGLGGRRDCYSPVKQPDRAAPGACHASRCSLRRLPR